MTAAASGSLAATTFRSSASPSRGCAPTNGQTPRQRQLFKNMVYLGALIHLIDLDGDVIEAALADQFKGKEKLIAPNVKALHLGRDYMAGAGGGETASRRPPVGQDRWQDHDTGQ